MELKGNALKSGAATGPGDFQLVTKSADLALLC